ncbi:tumor necrosis factor receptor superfamily member 9a [Brachyhypopomus gauderio]|uniref:tumor necrosis factor receptor superfamily member 9a n=1 Tax=Brachyhypopomus gauderio TaxID=698409 RepID=UPI0040416978
MQLILLSVTHIMTVLSLLYSTEGLSEGCDDWELSGSDAVCCLKCKPGNRMVKPCGGDPKTLCTPCSNGTYITHLTRQYCSRCRQCWGIQFEVQACTATTDTKCGCKANFRCGDDQCTFCVEECGKGSEPTPKRACRKCPYGTFNDKTHSACKPWSKSCPEGHVLVDKGDAFSDVKCSRIQAPTMESLSSHTQINISEDKVKKQPEDEMTWLLFIGGIGAFVGVFTLSLSLMYIRRKIKGEKEKPTTETLPQEELTIMIVEPDESCSYHQPEQEQGGSSESISTQDSESKLIV